MVWMIVFVAPGIRTILMLLLHINDDPNPPPLLGGTVITIAPSNYAFQNTECSQANLTTSIKLIENEIRGGYLRTVSWADVSLQLTCSLQHLEYTLVHFRAEQAQLETDGMEPSHWMEQW